jgi:hypothetical protein
VVTTPERREAFLATAGLRVYGEMVGLLWQAGEYPAAIRLEQLWHRLMKAVDFSLYCAYPIDIFGRGFEAGLIDALLCAHTHLLSCGPDDALVSARARGARGPLPERHGAALRLARPPRGVARTPAGGRARPDGCAASRRNGRRRFSTARATTIAPDA